MEAVPAVSAKNIVWATQTCTLGYDVLGNTKAIHCLNKVKQKLGAQHRCIVLKFYFAVPDFSIHRHMLPLQACRRALDETHMGFMRVTNRNMGIKWVPCGHARRVVPLMKARTLHVAYDVG